MCIRDSLIFRAGGDSDTNKIRIRPGGQVTFSRGTQDADTDNAVATKSYVDDAVASITGESIGIAAGPGLTTSLLPPENPGDSEIVQLAVDLAPMGSGLRFDTEGADGTLELDTDYLRTLEFAEGQVAFLRDIGNVNEVPPANHTGLTYDEVNDRRVAARSFTDIQASGLFDSEQVSSFLPVSGSATSHDILLSNWGLFSGTAPQGIEYIAADNAFQFNGELAFDLAVASRGVRVLAIATDNEDNNNASVDPILTHELHLERRDPASTDVNGVHTFSDTDWVSVASEIQGGSLANFILDIAVISFGDLTLSLIHI